MEIKKMLLKEEILKKEEILYWGKDVEKLWAEPYPEQYFYPNTRILYSGYIYEIEDSNIIYYGMLKNGIQDGMFVYFYENEKISCIQHYENGMLEGYYAQYNEDGTLLEDGAYHLGYKMYHNEYDKSGNKVMKIFNLYKREYNHSVSDGISYKINSLIEDKENKLKEEQSKLANFFDFENKIKIAEINIIAGVDLAYWKENGEEYAVCSIVAINFHTHEIIEKVSYTGKINFPYIAGYLAFREIPLFMKVEKMLKTNPDIYFFDGNGYLHPRHMGIAAHAGIVLHKPTVGIAKSYYKINNVDYEMPENKECAFTDITINNEIYGRVLRTKIDVKPIFVSVGNMIDLDTATELTKQLLTKDSHIPIPTRLADIETHIARKERK